MNKQGTQNELTFALKWIAVYCILQSLANPINEIIGIANSASAVFCAVQAVVLFSLLKKKNQLKQIGLCRSPFPARQFLYYVPLILLSTSNLWNGLKINLSSAETFCHIVLMLGVGFLEEVLFRGLLFKALAKDNVKTAVILTSVTFGLGHLLNLVNGSGMGLVSNLFQISSAIALGFLFVFLFYRGGSLIPCIVSHSTINILSAFVNHTGLSLEKRLLFSFIELAILISYVLMLSKTLPDKQISSQRG